MKKYLIRLDDACPTMDRVKWKKMEDILDAAKVKPMVGIIPNNFDPLQEIDNTDEGFWKKVCQWDQKGWSIALHGLNHQYISDKGMEGLNPMWKRSEFSGVPIEQQKEKIRKGVEILLGHGIDPHFFFAPSHTFDNNTIIALREESDIRIISDTIGRYPYISNGFLFVPQITGHCIKMPFSGIYTFCFHPNMMKDEDFYNLEAFIVKNKTHFTNFDCISNGEYGQKRMFDKILSWAFFKYRKIRGLR